MAPTPVLRFLFRPPGTCIYELKIYNGAFFFSPSIFDASFDEEVRGKISESSFTPVSTRSYPRGLHT